MPEAFIIDAVRTPRSIGLIGATLGAIIVLMIYGALRRRT